jgi:hypothetical protein
MKHHVQKLKSKPLSWSAMSSWFYDKDQWAKKYLDGIETPPNKEMLFGNVIGQKLASDQSFLPQVPRYKQFEKELRSKIGDIELIGFLDSFCPNKKYFHEYKTSSNQKKWTQKSCEEHGQLDFYFFLLWLNYGKLPEEINCMLHYIPVGENGQFEMELQVSEINPVKSFKVKKTVKDILKFGNEIKKVYKEMEKFAKQYKGS